MLPRALRSLAVCIATLGFVALPGACSSNGAEPPKEQVGKSEQAITDACTINQVGAPCNAGTGDCSGLCVINAAGTGATCAATTATANDGKVCGRKASDKSDCGKTCLGGLCVSAVAADATPCKPSADFGGGFGSSLCDGVCQSGACVDRAVKCPRDTNPTDCVYNFCDARTGACTDIAHPAASPCSGSNRCDNYACDGAGTCAVTGPAPASTSCVTGLVCTMNDHCDGSGSCIGDPVTCPPSTNPCLESYCAEPGGCTTRAAAGSPACAPSNKCVTGVCSSGACTATTTPIDCSSGDPCTIDSCNPSLGCQHAPKCVSDACTTSTCTSTGTCATTPVNCDDGNPCTTDGCALPGGCTHAPIAGCGDAGVDGGPADTGAPDTTPATDTAVGDTTPVDDSAAADTTPVPDTATPDDTASALDTAPPDGALPTDTASPDSGATIDTGAGGGDTGAVDTGALGDGARPDTSSSGDGSLVDAGADAATDDGGDVKLNSGCGCRAAGDEGGPSTASGLVLALAGAFALRRRRRA